MAQQHNKVALILVDIQYDFLETGTLPIPDSSHIIPKAEQLIAFIDSIDGLVVATQDWHPRNHKSFASNHPNKVPFDAVDLTFQEQTNTQVLWPDHCIQGTPGAALVKEIEPLAKVVVQKGTNPDIDSYSGFADNLYHCITSLAKHLYQHQIETVVICGLAADYCVKMTCLDAVKFGFKTLLIQDATRATASDQLKDTLETLRSRGVQIIPSTQEFIANSPRYLSPS